MLSISLAPCTDIVPFVISMPKRNAISSNAAKEKLLGDGNTDFSPRLRANVAHRPLRSLENRFCGANRML